MSNFILRGKKFSRRFKRNPIFSIKLFLKNRLESVGVKPSTSIQCKALPQLNYNDPTFKKDLRDLIVVTADLEVKEAAAVSLKGVSLVLLKKSERAVDKALRKMFWEALKSSSPQALPVAATLVHIYEEFSKGVGERTEYLTKMKRQNLGIVEMVMSSDIRKGRLKKRNSGDFLKGGYFVHNCLPFSNGGYAIRTDYIATALNAKEMELMCIARLGFPGDLSTEYKLENNEQVIHGVKYIYHDDIGRGSHHLNEYLGHATEYYEKVMIDNDLKFAVAASNHVTALPVLMAARRVGIPFVYDMRGLWEVTRLSRDPAFEQTFNYRLQCFAENYIVEHADGMSFISRSLETYIENRSGIRRKSNTVITRNSADLARFISNAPSNSITLDKAYSKADGDFVFGYIGSFVIYEGLELLVEAFHAVRQTLEPELAARIKLILVGSDNASSAEDKGPIFTALEEYIVTNKLESFIFMTGRIDSGLIPTAYQFLDCCVLPRISSPVTEIVTPLKPAETLACGVPILSSNVGGLKEMTSDCDQVQYFEAGNVSSLANKMIAILAAHELGGDPFFDSDMAKAYAIANFDHRESCDDLSRMITKLVAEAAHD
jgi:glycosyltransferase involved in cell wall biosynthesis